MPCLSVRRVRLSLAAAFALIAVAGCGDEGIEGDYVARCEMLCEIDQAAAAECVPEDEMPCVQACVTHTNGLEVGCAECLIEQSEGLRAAGFQCRGPELAPITDPTCASFCEP